MVLFFVFITQKYVELHKNARTNARSLTSVVWIKLYPDIKWHIYAYMIGNQTDSV